MTWPYKVRAGEGRFCSTVCRARFEVDTAPVRFWTYVEKTQGCWLWNGGAHEFGYGKFTVDHRSVAAHRYSYELANGSIPDGLFVLHRCDVGACVRPDHLFLGTQADNLADMVVKGRSLAGDRNISRTAPERLKRGEESFNAVLTDDAVRAIRRLHVPRKVTIDDLAGQFGVGRGTVKDVLSRTTWRHVA